MHLNEEFIVKAVPGINFLYQPVPILKTFGVDSRKISAGEIFIALKGAKVDGHDFIEQAIAQGAAGLMIEQSKKDCLKKIDASILKKLCVMVVPNTLEALLALATAWRAQFNIPVVCITGSFGKTSVKERVAHILSLAGKNYLASYGNQNTVIGVSLNILRMRSEHEVAVFELGINKRGEMRRLVAIAQPTIAVITAIGHCHMEGLGSLSDIASEKREIFAFFKEHNIGIVNGDQKLLSHVAYNHPVIKFGQKTTNQVQARKVNQSGQHINFVLKLYKEKYQVKLTSHLKGVVDNALAATACAYLLNIPAPIIVQGIQENISISGRFDPCPLIGNKGMMINDSYNASPESMKAALLAFERYDTLATKIAVLGDMTELGATSPFWHRQLGRFLRKIPSLQSVVLVGTQVAWTKKTIPVGVNVELVPNWQEAKQVLLKQLDGNSLVLVKGSRAIELDQLVKEVCLSAGVSKDTQVGLNK
ncbi:MAG: UDP-N-acetylmuramoyl-tripeptide--D-alanyl-D-alanine ligase [Candidatus Babeliales bacterium]